MFCMYWWCPFLHLVNNNFILFISKKMSGWRTFQGGGNKEDSLELNNKAPEPDRSIMEFFKECWHIH